MLRLLCSSLPTLTSAFHVSTTKTTSLSRQLFCFLLCGCLVPNGCQIFLFFNSIKTLDKWWWLERRSCSSFQLVSKREVSLIVKTKFWIVSTLTWHLRFIVLRSVIKENASLFEVSESWQCLKSIWFSWFFAGPLLTILRLKLILGRLSIIWRHYQLNRFVYFSLLLYTVNKNIAFKYLCFRNILHHSFILSFIYLFIYLSGVERDSQ